MADTHKVCLRCKNEKTVEYFSFDASKADGRRSHCKACVKEYRNANREKCKEINAKWRADNKEKVDALKKEWRDNNPEKARQYTKQWRLRNKDSVKKYDAMRRILHKDKVRAREIVKTAVRSGLLTRKPCERCGDNENVQAHHKDYSKPLSVVWLCPRHHKEVHNKMV